MNKNKDKILIIGGYGAVGKIVSKILAEQYPGKVIIAGRNKFKASSLIYDHKLNAIPIKLDLSSGSFNDIDFEQIHTAISCIEYLQDDNFIQNCIRYQIHYTELATSFESYLRLLRYEEDVKKSKTLLIPGVGLMPGLSGVFVQDSISRLSKIEEVRSFVLLGLGEQHGLDAIRWMLKYANQTYTLKTINGFEQVKSFTDPIKEQLLSETRPRKFYRFNFGDQHIINRTTEVNSAQTRIAFDSRIVTVFIGIMRKIGLLKRLSKINPQIVKQWLDKFGLGSEVFAVQTHCYGSNDKEIIYLAEGNNEARATGVIASYAVSLLYKSSGIVGIQRLEQIVEPENFFNYLKSNQIHISIKIK